MEQRLTALLEARVTKLEAEVTRLWQAVRESFEFTVEYGQLLRDHKLLELPADPNTPSGLSSSDEDKLLHRLAPILLWDTGGVSRSRRFDNWRRLFAARWLVENCGVVKENPAA